ncbi:hypothetical protein JCM10207_004832 [Rhodosporidiobolus poonsookiae]
MAQDTPPELPILPLPADTVVFPGLSFSVQLTSSHAVELVHSVVKDASLRAGSQTPSSALLIGCVPLKAKATLSNAIADAANRYDPSKSAKGGAGGKADSGGKEDKGEEKATQVLSTTGKGSGAAENGGKPDKEELFEYGTVARIARLERLATASGGGFLLVVEGIARFSFNPATLDSSSPFFAATITVHEPSEDALTSSHDPLVEVLRDAAASLLNSQSGMSSLPPLFIRRLRARLARLSSVTAAAFVDLCIGTLPLSPSGTGLVYADKLLILSLVDPVQRIEKAIELLTRADEAAKLAKRIGERVDQSVQRRQRATILMQQLAAIKQELDELTAQEKGGARAGKPAAPGKSRSLPLKGGEEDEDEDDLAELEKKIEAKQWSEEARKTAVREMKRLKKSPPQGAEHGVIRTYIETLLALPWTAADATPLPKDPDFIAKARKKLDEDHYGLEKIKKRLLEYLAVLRLQQEQADAALAALPPSAPASITETATSSLGPSTETAVVLRDPSTPAPPAPVFAAPPAPAHPAPILLLHGPPGCGKTSIARSLADAMGRKFVRISLGGVRDEAEIRGHRRTYVGALPGKIVDALRKAGTSNCVVLLDEIDKIGHDSMRGAPDAALLEVLDPAQNSTFSDHYLGIPIDLSQVLFIATANNLETISEPLYDRMEAVELSGYVHDEKLHIARQSLLPKQLAAHALTPSLLHLSDSTLLYLITHWTREAGVRSLERTLAAVCRAKAVEYADARARAGGVRGELPEGYRVKVNEEDVERILGPSRFDLEELDPKGNRVGVATGLAYQGSGNGGILHIETTHFAGSGKLLTTGQLGEVISESAQVAYAWVKAHAYELGITHALDAPDAFRHLDLHLHLPAGSVKKDGPSAGVAMVVAMVSLMLGVPTVKGVGMTGEVTLRGVVSPIGGVKEKVLAAHRAGLTLLLLPRRNKRDVDQDVPASVRDEVEFVYVDRVEDALQAAFGGKVRMRERETGIVESRL